ncbi:MAG: hypothetical protein GKR89_23155 [Candidatus Latescibacteria bacterium]|nr:hypothetical protein [Candidatus Latescibacterota bacterium]
MKISAWPALVVGLLLILSPPQASATVDPAIVQGITISTHGSGRDWGSDAMAPTMESIRQVGANWVSIHPYARIGADGSVRFRPIDPENPPAYLVRPIAEAHRLGLNICIKPHLAYWGSPFSWRGEITFATDAEWQRFWSEYENWIVQVARACRKTDAFVVGTELDQTLHDEDRWRRIIAQVRKETDAPLTYAANWPDYQRVPFWDALDIIGIQAYFPLVKEKDPSREELRLGWQRLMGQLRAYAQTQNRRIVFTELGYNQSHLAPVEPWDYHVDGEPASPIQEACLEMALEAIAAEETVVGTLLWKWFPHPRPVGRNFQLATPRLMRIISAAWQPQP